MMLFLNKYAYIYEKNGCLYLRGKSMQEICIVGIKEQLFLKNMFSKGKTLKEIENILGTQITAQLLTENILIDMQSDTIDRHSRTDGYYSLFYSTSCEKLRNKKVLVLGAGALGSYLSLSLSMYGLNKLIIVDFDTIDVTNLNRQILYSEKDINRNKVDILYDEIKKRNSNITIIRCNKKINNEADLDKIFLEYGEVDFIVKAIDSPIDILYSINRFCVEKQIPYISGGFNGYFLVIDNIYIPNHTICYECKDNSYLKNLTLSSQITWGTTPEMPGILGGIMTNIIVKILMGNYSEVFLNGAYIFNLKTNTTSFEKYSSKENICKTCNWKVDIKNEKKIYFPKYIIPSSILSVIMMIIILYYDLDFFSSQFLIFSSGTVISLINSIVNSKLQIVLIKNIIYYTLFEVFFLIMNHRIFYTISFDESLVIVFTVVLYIFIMTGISCLFHYIKLIFLCKERDHV